VTWSKIRRDMEKNRDPDYDSDEEEAWSYDLLRMLSFVAYYLLPF
jgi:hypothetical protein